MRSVHKFTQGTLKARHDPYIARNADLHRPHNFKVGAKARLHRIYPGRARPGTDKAWFWPFRPELYDITGLLSAQHVRIRRSPTSNKPPGKSRVVHVARLKPYVPRDDVLQYRDISPSLETTDGV